MCVLNANAQEGNKPDDLSAILEAAREGFFRAGSEPCYAPELEGIIGEAYTTSSLLQAYKGAGKTMHADCLRSPGKKLKSFKQGRELLDKAVDADPGNAEIRFIRYMVQDGAPSFLNYDNRDQDLQIWFDFYSKSSNASAVFIQKMARAINNTDFPDSDQKDILNRIIKNI